MRVIGRQAAQRSGRRGLTLVECMVALTIFPLVVTAISLAIIAGQAQAAEAMRQSRAALLAESLMEEVAALVYDTSEDATLGPDGGETSRDLFDSPNDFHGYSEATGSLTDATGVAYPGPMQRFNRSVSCSVKSISVTGLTGAVAGLEVVVTVNDGDDRVVVLTRFLADQS